MNEILKVCLSEFLEKPGEIQKKSQKDLLEESENELLEESLKKFQKMELMGEEDHIESLRKPLDTQ